MPLVVGRTHLRAVLAFILAFAFASRPDALHAATRFVRADANGNGTLDITDGIYTLGYLFLGSPASIPCEDAADSNDNGSIQISDAIYTLSFLFLGTAAPPPPSGDGESACGLDPTDDLLGCGAFDRCPQITPPPAPPVLDQPTSPTSDAAVDLSGTAGPGLLLTVVGGSKIAETRAGADGKFSVRVELQPNRLNRLSAIAADAASQVSAPSTVEVIQDSAAPFVYIDEPLDGSHVMAEMVTVTGRVADMLSGFAGLTVNVNGLPANVAIGIGTNGTFERQGVPLTLGQANPITVVATDGVGNAAKPFRIEVTRDEIPPTADRLEAVSGNGQPPAPIHTFLPNPVVVRAAKAEGSPIPGKLVTFKVTRSDGRLASRMGLPVEEETRTLLVTTDQDGNAAALWRMGSDAGCGNDRLLVTGEGLVGSVVFCASVKPGPAAQINIGSGNNQRVEAGAPAVEPLKAWVSDACNGIAGVPVTFRVTRGSGKVNGLDSVTVPTGPTGHAQVNFVLGPEAGNQYVEANFEGHTGSPATFVAFALVRDPGQPTTFSGLVLDNAQQPIRGAVVILEVPGFEGVQGTTDLNGGFRLEAPAGGPASLSLDFHITPGANASGEAVRRRGINGSRFSVACLSTRGWESLAR